VFGADDYDIFISHASEDRAAIARPIYEACERLGLKAFLDEEHIAWGETFTKKINIALGAARTVLAVISSTSVGKDWPLTEVNTALTLEVSGDKTVVPLIIGKPDLSRLPLIRGKDYLVWKDDPLSVALKLREAVTRQSGAQEAARASRSTSSVPTVSAAVQVRAPPARPPVDRPPADQPRSWLQKLFGKPD
jgi:hypothetical protein